MNSCGSVQIDKGEREGGYFVIDVDKVAYCRDFSNPSNYQIVYEAQKPIFCLERLSSGTLILSDGCKVLFFAPQADGTLVEVDNHLFKDHEIVKQIIVLGDEWNILVVFSDSTMSQIKVKA